MVPHDVDDPPRGVQGLVRGQGDGAVRGVHAHAPRLVLGPHVLGDVRLPRGELDGGGRLRVASAADHAAGDGLPLQGKLLAPGRAGDAGYLRIDAPLDGVDEVGAEGFHLVEADPRNYVFAHHD